jgi:uncharacterized protein (AIM24 family)
MAVTVHGAPVFATVRAELPPGRCLLARSGCTAYVRGDVQQAVGKASAATGDESGDGSGDVSGIWVPVNGETLTLNGFVGMPPTGGAVVLSPPLPGDVAVVELAPDRSLLFTRTGFLCSTEDVRLAVSLNLAADVHVCKASGDAPARVWLAAYGAFEVHTLAVGESIRVNNGMFLAAVVDDPDGEGAAWEGAAMRFAGPATVWTQSRSLRALAAELQQNNG